MAEVRNIKIEQVQQGKSTGEKITKAVATPISSTVTGAFGFLGNTLAGVGNTVKGCFTGNFSDAANSFTDAGKSLASPITDTADAIGDCFTSSPKTTTITTTDEKGNQKQLQVTGENATINEEQFEKMYKLYQQALKDAQAQNSGCSGTKSGGCSGGGGKSGGCSGGGQGANQLSRADFANALQAANQMRNFFQNPAQVLGNALGQTLIDKIFGDSNKVSGSEKASGTASKTSEKAEAKDSITKANLETTDLGEAKANANTIKEEKESYTAKQEEAKAGEQRAIGEKTELERKYETAKQEHADAKKELDRLNNEEKPQKKEKMDNDEKAYNAAVENVKTIEGQEPKQSDYKKKDSEGKTVDDKEAYEKAHKEWEEKLKAAKTDRDEKKASFDESTKQYNTLVKTTIPRQEQTVEQKTDAEEEAKTAVEDKQKEIDDFVAKQKEYAGLAAQAEVEEGRANEHVKKLEEKQGSTSSTGTESAAPAATPGTETGSAAPTAEVPTVPTGVDLSAPSGTGSNAPTASAPTTAASTEPTNNAPLIVKNNGANNSSSPDNNNTIQTLSPYQKTKNQDGTYNLTVVLPETQIDKVYNNVKIDSSGQAELDGKKYKIDLT